MSPAQRLIHRLLCLLLLTLVFEGLARKLTPQAFGTAIFFFKDLMVAVLLYLCWSSGSNSLAKGWLSAMGLLLMLLFPCLIVTGVHDPLLAIFGAKQYVLYPAVAVAICTAYGPNHRRPLFVLFRLVAVSVVLTTLVAVAQNRLPSDHWLNLSVGGEDLSGFSAGGYLRVSSTFSFVAQYCAYLNALCYLLPAYFCLSKGYEVRGTTAKKIILLGLCILGAFVTGSRGAVIGGVAILGAGGVLLLLVGGGGAIGKIVVPILIGAVLFTVLQTQYPELFAAYQARVEGTGEESHSIEIIKRVEGNLLQWANGSSEVPMTIFGYGLGVMSNGSEKLSSYAANWRSGDFWTESDQATTFFEGGWYLVFVWYGFRFWVIIQALGLVLRLKQSDLRFAACFAWGFILVIGVNGTLALQPPLAIWWWLAVGFVGCLVSFDRVQAKPKPVPGIKQEVVSAQPV